MLECLLGSDGVELVQRKIWRNGPPDAVSQIVFTSLWAPTRRHWWTALCSLSMGRMGTLRSRAAASEDFASGDHAFLVGESDGLAGQNGGVGCFKAGDADDGGDDEIGLARSSARDGACGAVNDFDAGDAGGLAAAEVRSAASSSVASETICGRQRTAWEKASSTLRPAASVATL